MTTNVTPAAGTAEYLAMLRRPGQGSAGTVDAPEFGPGAKVYVRRLSIPEATALRKIVLAEDTDHIQKATAALPLCLDDPDGNRVFLGDDAAAEVERTEFPLALARRVIDRASVLCMGGGDDAAKKG